MENSVVQVAKEIKEGMVVKFINPENGNRNQSGWMRVTKVTKNTVNLGAIFGRGIYHKGVDKALIVEDETAWYAAWQQSDTYRCM